MSARALPTTRQSTRLPLGRIVRIMALAALVASAVNLVVWAIAKFALGIPLRIPLGPPGSPIVDLPPIMIIIATVVGLAGGAVLLAILSRLVAQPVRVFTIVASIVLILSFAMPFSLPVDLATRLTLDVMHVVAGLTLIGLVAREDRATI
jgi:hypothetical protein